jgi:hypothetical protein
MSYRHCLVAHAKNCVVNQRFFRFMLKPGYFQGELYQFLCTIALIVFETGFLPNSYSACQEPSCFPAM